MKILELAPYIFIENHYSASRKQTGLAYMVRSICDMLAREHEVRVFTQAVITQEMKVGQWLLLGRKYWNIFTHLKFRYLILALKNYKRYRQLGLARTFLYWLSAGQVEDYMRKWKPNVIHIHGIGPSTLPYYYAAARLNMSVVTTLHGLISFNDLYPKPETEMSLERRFIKMCVKEGYSMTFISTGMKRIVSEFCKSDCSNIRIIFNCYRQPNISIIKNINMKSGEIHLSCIGTLSLWKNQIQVIRILPILQERLLNKGKIILDLYGNGEMEAEWKQYCINNKLKNVVFHGRVSQETIFAALKNTALLVFSSIEEGFGIPIIEAYSCGTPVVSYPDLDASEDLASEDCIVFTKDRTDEAMAEAIFQALNKTWDKEKIIAFSKHFTMDAIAIQYSDEMQKPHKRWNLENVKRVIENY